MEILKRGENVPPKFFITDCRKVYGRGCGAVLKVTPEDCFRCPFQGKPCHWLSFYCEQCGLILTPDERCEEKELEGLPEDVKAQFPVRTTDNVPPWSHIGFPTFDEFNKKHGIEWGIRPA